MRRRLAPFPALSALSALLVLLLAVTTAGLGQARGLVRQADMLVICQGGRVVTVPAPDGAPGRARHVLCPDMAPGLMAALSLPAAFTAPIRTLAAYMRAAPPVAGALAPGPLPRARDPPWLAA